MEIQKINSQTTISTREINVGKIYKHYSGKLYKVLALAHDSEDPSLLRVVYQGLYDCPTFGPNPIWTKSHAMFAENVVINGKEQARFEEVTTVSCEDIFHVGIKVIIRNSNNKILLLKVEKRTKNYWDLPGGRVQINEEFTCTGLREVAEETGITNLSNIQHVGMVTSIIRIPTNQQQTVGLIFSFHHAQTDSDTIILSSEHQDYEWVTPEKALERLLPSYGETFKECLNKLG